MLYTHIQHSAAFLFPLSYLNQYYTVFSIYGLSLSSFGSIQSSNCLSESLYILYNELTDLPNKTHYRRNSAEIPIYTKGYGPLLFYKQNSHF